MQSLIERDSYTSSASWSNRIRVPVLSLVGHYTVHFADPDIHIDWPDVLQVILPTSASALSSVATTKLDQSVAGDTGTSNGVPACPICLSEPVAPRMDLKSVKWFIPDAPSSVPAAASPPASVEPVDADLARALELSKLDAQDGRSSTASESAPTSRERLKMRLIRRPQITTLALPRSATWPSTAVPPLRAPWNFTPDAFTYAKFFLGAPDYLRDELLAQKAQLEAEIQTLRRFGQRGGTDEQLGIVFIDAALRKVDEQLQKVELLKTTAVMTARKRSLRELHDIQQLRAADADDRLPPVTDTSASELEAASDVDTSRSDYLSTAAARQPLPAPPVYDPIPLDFLHTRSTPLAAGAPPFTPSTTAPPAVISATLSPPRTRTAQKRSSVPTEQPVDDVAYYFYQAASGQPIFLSPLDIKILKSHFGTYQAMPDNIEVVVEGADEGSMNDELRRRCKWLGHLPVASDVVFIEADLSTVVPKKALAPYTTALRQRRTKRRDKARKEDRAKQRSEQKAAEALPVHESTYAFGAPGGLPFGFAAASSWDDDQAFPATSTSPGPGRPSSPRRAAAPFVADAPTRSPPPLPQAARPSFASAVHASSRSAGGSSSTQSAWDDALEDRWGQLEEEIGRRRAASPRTAAASGVSAPGETNSNGQGKKGKRAKKLTLHLSGSALRGAG
ncbi:hypothetical protein C6P46_001065 [Rhodotorula mucilaginosa]|uniref:Uncharacterized protein n=1 Tax=Rhodotorula mucilaginosa TaxID=5537 RepID=A0A9P6VUG7_RHOMI|nr:hypothetical protein C6P46_001065 [Rhodotorula mucilaginosa]